jgi:hypothetical protein
MKRFSIWILKGFLMKQIIDNSVAIAIKILLPAIDMEENRA